MDELPRRPRRSGERVRLDLRSDRAKGHRSAPEGHRGVCVCMIFHLALGKRNLLTGTACFPNGSLDYDSRKCDSLGVKLREGLPDAVSGAFFFCWADLLFLDG